MELSKDAPRSMDLGYQLPEPGIYVWQIQEGIEKFHNENSGKTSLKIPLKVDAVIEGNEEGVGMTSNHFIPIETAFGEKQLACFLSITGLVEKFMDKFGKDVEPLDDKFLAALKLKLRGKFVQATHEIRENNKGQKNVQFLNFSEVGKKKAGGFSEEPPTQPADSDSGW